MSILISADPGFGKTLFMNTKSLKLGQTVYMIIDCGQLICKGKVVKVTPKGVDVETESSIPCNNGELLHFDSNGNEYNPSRINTFDYAYGDWHIDVMPFAERTAELKDIGLGNI